MKNKLKILFPKTYAYYQHLKRMHRIHKINRIKKMPFEKQLNLIEQTYAERVGHLLDWNNLRTYTEKMQWAKVYDMDPLKSQLSDKYAVRSWVAEKIGEEHLIPLLGCWDRFEDIDFSMLPEQFVLKTNNGCGTNLIVKNKESLHYKEAKRLFKDWLAMDFAYNNPVEYHYSIIPPKIIAEKYMSTKSGDLPDYKFLCFHGKPYYCWVDQGRYLKHTCDFFDMEWNHQSWHKYRFSTCETPIPKPENFEEMVVIATKLCEGFSHVRVDLYNVDGKIYFGEMTFTYASGFSRLVPDSADCMLGDLWKVDTSVRKKETNI